MPQGINTLERYIAHEKEQAIDGNQCDNRPTYQRELDGIIERCTEMYERGQTVVMAIPEGDLILCRRLYDSEKKPLHYYADDLVQTTISGQWVIVPIYVTLIRRVEKLKVLFAQD